MAQNNFDDKIVIDSAMFERLRLLVMYSQHELLIAQKSETILSSLHVCLQGSDDVEALKSLRLLTYYLDSVPACVSDAINWLQEVVDILDSIAANQL